MSIEHIQDECGRHRDELLRLSCGDVPAPLDDLRAHLTVCAACRGKLAAFGKLVGELGTALGSESLPDALRGRITRELDAWEEQANVRVHRLASVSLGLAGLAVAAGFLLVVILPWGAGSQSTGPADGRAPEVTLSKDDTTAIARAYAVLRWDDLAEYALDVLADRAKDMARAVERGPGAESALPWGAEDDWDVPTRTGKSSAIEQVQALCAQDCASSEMCRS